jgi:small subunit ribosomal protein S8
MPSSKVKMALAQILKAEGFIQGFEIIEGASPQSVMRIQLHYLSEGEPALKGLKRVSRPGLRVYVGKGEIPRYYGGMGVAIVSTSKGIMTGRDSWREKIGGELLCYVW